MRGAHLPPCRISRNLTYSTDALGWLRHTSLPYTIGLIGILIGLGHSVLAMSGEETMAQVYREIEHPKLPNLEKAGFVIFRLQPDFHGRRGVFRGDDHSRFGAPQFLRQSHRRAGHVSRWAVCRCGLRSGLSSWWSAS